jgi:transposase
VSTYRQADTKQAGGKRRHWSTELKRELVAATFEPGSSVSIVARRHDVNANQLFKWRRQLAVAVPAPARLVPVEVAPGSAGGPLLEAGPPVPIKPAPGRIEITLAGGVRVKIEGAVDPAAVTAALSAVMKVRRRRPTPRGQPRGDPGR